MSVDSKITNQDEDKIKLSVVIDDDEFEREVDDALKRLSKNIKLPGFRPGKIPRKVLEARLGPTAGRQDALEHSLPTYYGRALIDNEVDAIGPPEIEITSDITNGAVTFEATVPIRPKPSITGHSALEIEIPSPIVTEEEFQAQLDSMRKHLAELEEVEKPAEDGDLLTIDIEGTKDGEPVPGLSATDYLYEVGSGTILSEVDEYLTGSSKGDEIEFEAKHPTEEGPISISIKVGQLQVRILPEVDNEFASQVSEFETADELLKDLRHRMDETKSQQVGMLARDLTAKAIGDLIQIELPEGLIENEIDRRIRDLEMRLNSQGLELEKYLEATGGEIEAIREDFRETAEISARIDLGLRAVAHVEYLDEEEDNFEKYLENMEIQMQMKPEELHDALKTSGRLMDVRADIAKEAALQWVFDRVNLLDEDGNTVDSGILEIKQPDIPDIAQKISENNDVEADDLSDDDLVSEQIIDEDNNDGEN
ncbi:MAG: trigger factor [Acidimicrobiaceae bacterium]|nr:trigger factor [Acidimicrobiaceae bacterium]